MADLLPCPFCGGECATPRSRAVVCMYGCGYRLAAVGSISAAIAAHNRIASLATLGKEVVELAERVANWDEWKWTNRELAEAVHGAVNEHRARTGGKP